MADKKNDDHKESMTTAEAGEKGGNKVLNERGHEFYSDIASQQGKENNPGNFANRPKNEVKEAGRRGGESRGSDNSAAHEDEDMDEAA